MVFTVFTDSPKLFVGYIESAEAARAAIAVLGREFKDVGFHFCPGPDYARDNCTTEIRRRLLSKDVQDKIRDLMSRNMPAHDLA